MHPFGVSFRRCLNNKISSAFSCLYHNLFVSLPPLRIAGNVRTPSERKAKGLTRFVSEVPDVLDYLSSGAFLFWLRPWFSICHNDDSRALQNVTTKFETTWNANFVLFEHGVVYALTIVCLLCGLARHSASQRFCHWWRNTARMSAGTSSSGQLRLILDLKNGRNNGDGLMVKS